MDETPTRPQHRIGTARQTPLEWPVVLAVALLASGVAWLRMPSSVAEQLYAEDGPLFFAQWSTDGASVVFAPYAGYQHLLPRLLSAAIAASLPVSYWAVATNISVCLAIGVVAGLVVVCTRDVTRSTVLRGCLGLLAALAPFAHLEAVGNLANLHWFLLYAMMWLLLATPRSWVGAWAMATATLLAMLTETQGVFLLPLVCWRLWRDGRRVWPVALAWATGALVQVASYLSAPRALPPGRPPPASVLEGYLFNVGLGSFSVRPPVLAWVLEHTSFWQGAAVAVLCAAVVVTGVVLARGPTRVALVGLSYGSLASWTASFVLGGNPGYYYSELPWTEWMLVRWGTTSSMLFLAALLLSLDVIGQHWRPLRVPTGAARLAVLGLLVLGAPWDLPAAEDTWQSRVAAAQSTCATGASEVIVTSAPALQWQMRLPCPLLR